MTPQQGHRYRSILYAMTQEMRVLIATLDRDGASFRPFGLESKAITPLTSELTLTGSSGVFSSRSTTPRLGSIAAAPSSMLAGNVLNSNVAGLELSTDAAIPVAMPPSARPRLSVSVVAVKASIWGACLWAQCRAKNDSAARDGNTDHFLHSAYVQLPHFHTVAARLCVRFFNV